MEMLDASRTNDDVAGTRSEKGDGMEEFENGYELMVDSTLLPPNRTPEDDGTRKSVSEEEAEAGSEDGSEDGSEETGLKAAVIVASMFLFHLIEIGIKGSFGLFIGDLVFQFDTNIHVIGFILGFYTSFDELLAPFIAPLTKCTSVLMPVMLGGSFTMALCLSLTSMAPSVVCFAVTLCMSGVAFAFVRTLARIVFSEHFTKHFALVSGMADLGNSVGVLVPLVTERFLDIYGWRGTTLILGGLNFNYLILCYAMPVKRRRDRLLAEQDANADSKDPSNQGSGSRNAVKQNGDDCDGAGEKLLAIKPSESDRHADNGETQKSKKETAIAMYHTDATATAAAAADGGDDDDEMIDSKQELDASNTMKDKILRPFRWIWTVLDWSICRDEPYLNFVLLTVVLFALVGTAFYIFLIPHALSKGITLSQAVHLAVITGVGDMIGTFGQGPILDRGLMTSSGLFMLLAGLSSALLLIDPLIKGFMWLTICSFFIGMSLEGQITLTFVIFKDITPPSRFVTAYGLSAITSGLSGPIGGFLAGWIAAQLGFEMMFLVFGGVGILSILALVPAHLHYTRHQEEYVPQEELKWTNKEDTSFYVLY